MTDAMPRDWPLWWRDKAPRHEMPERVKAAIAEREDESERLISLVQLAVVLTFGTLYFISPKAFSEDVAFAPVPWALAVYLVFTVIRAVGAYRGRLPGWFLALSVVIDMSLLMVLIWSFHLQYEQPASFYLKVPTILYVFIFISLRALRFDARYVALAGISAILGWGALVVYALYGETGDMMVTRDYVRYMTSNSILIGAEFDKIITILTVTVILVVTLQRGRSLLVRAVAEGAAVRDLSRFFDANVAAQITGSEHEVRAGEGQAREAAILIIDVRGFTMMSHTMEPRELISLLAEYQSLVVPLLQREGGNIDKFLGDGIMATFGAAEPNQTHAADALRAMGAALDALDEWNAERKRRGDTTLPISAAAAAGRLIFGAVGDETRLEYTVIGEPVNLAAKLEKHTREVGAHAIVTAETYHRAVAQGYRPQAEPELHRGAAVQGVDGLLDLVVIRR